MDHDWALRLAGFPGSVGNMGAQDPILVRCGHPKLAPFPKRITKEHYRQIQVKISEFLKVQMGQGQPE